MHLTTTRLQISMKLSLGPYYVVIVPAPANGYCLGEGARLVGLCVHLCVCPSEWSNLLQVQTTIFQFRGGYACCAVHCRFC